MSAALTFGLPPTGTLDDEALGALASILRRFVPMDLDPMVFETYTALSWAITNGNAAIGWCPPFVALDLMDQGVARPIAALERKGGTHYASVLIVRESEKARTIFDLKGLTMGWIAPESAAGYAVPRSHLVSHGIEPETFFFAQHFLGSHGAAVMALRTSEVDVIATFARYLPASRVVIPPQLGFPTRVITAAGPVPGDLIVARTDLPPVVQQAVSRSFVELPVQLGAALREVMGIRRFVPVTSAHIDALNRLRSSGFAMALDVLDASIDDPPTGG